MPGQTSGGEPPPHNKTKQKFISIYVHKRLFFDVWPPRSTDCCPLDFFSVGGHLKSLVYSAPIENKEKIYRRNSHACQNLCNCPGTLEKWDSP